MIKESLCFRPKLQSNGDKDQFGNFLWNRSTVLKLLKLMIWRKIFTFLGTLKFQIILTIGAFSLLFVYVINLVVKSPMGLIPHPSISWPSLHLRTTVRYNLVSISRVYEFWESYGGYSLIFTYLFIFLGRGWEQTTSLKVWNYQ